MNFYLMLAIEIVIAIFSPYLWMDYWEKKYPQPKVPRKKIVWYNPPQHTVKDKE